MSIESVIESWREVRNGLIDEANHIPVDKFSFQPGPESRSVKQLLQHLVESQKFLVGEACRPDTNLMRGSFADNVKLYAPNVRDVNDKDELLNLLRGSMDEVASQLMSASDEMKNTMKRFDGKEMPKLAFMSFAIAHEMYHRGQLTVYERLPNIEPLLTQRFRNGLKRYYLLERSGKGSFLFRSELGQPRFDSASIPFQTDQPLDRVIGYPLEVGGTVLKVTALQMGNPNCCVFVDDFEAIEWRR